MVMRSRNLRSPAHCRCCHHSLLINFLSRLMQALIMHMMSQMTVETMGRMTDIIAMANKVLGVRFALLVTHLYFIPAFIVGHQPGGSQWKMLLPVSDRVCRIFSPSQVHRTSPERIRI